MYDAVSEILDGELYIGSLYGLNQLEFYGITHVLSVINFPLEKKLKNCKQLRISLQDSESENLIRHLPEALTFITDALSGSPETQGRSETHPSSGPGGRVLVHCQAGVSRSVSVVAAWLMKSRQLSVAEALALIVDRRPQADPNEGFRAQLQLFQDMHYSLDADHPVYRCLQLELMGQYVRESGGYFETGALAKLPMNPAAALAAGQTLFRCGKCRALLATSANEIPTDAAMGHKIFRDRQRLHLRKPTTTEDAGPGETSLFVEPMTWMHVAVQGQTQGKLHCLTCKARLGSFNWSGITNTAGNWVTPAFQLHLSKVDPVSPTPGAVVAGAAFPAGAGGRPAQPRPLMAMPRTLAANAAAAAVAAAAAAASGTAAAAPSTADALSVVGSVATGSRLPEGFVFIPAGPVAEAMEDAAAASLASPPADALEVEFSFDRVPSSSAGPKPIVVPSAGPSRAAAPSPFPSASASASPSHAVSPPGLLPCLTFRQRVPLQSGAPVELSPSANATVSPPETDFSFQPISSPPARDFPPHSPVFQAVAAPDAAGALEENENSSSQLQSSLPRRRPPPLCIGGAPPPPLNLAGFAGTTGHGRAPPPPLAFPGNAAAIIASCSLPNHGNSLPPPPVVLSAPPIVVPPTASATATLVASTVAPLPTVPLPCLACRSIAPPETEVRPPEPKRWFTHLIVDCDGILVNTERANCESLRQAILEVTGYDIPHQYPQDFIDVMGMDELSCVQHYAELRRRLQGESKGAPRRQGSNGMSKRQLGSLGGPAEEAVAVNRGITGEDGTKATESVADPREALWDDVESLAAEVMLVRERCFRCASGVTPVEGSGEEGSVKSNRRKA